VTCPYCGRNNTRHGCPDDPGSPPEPGNLSLCWGCRGVSVFMERNGRLELRKPTAGELIEFAADPGIQEILTEAVGVDRPMTAISRVRRKRNQRR